MALRVADPVSGFQGDFDPTHLEPEGQTAGIWARNLNFFNDLKAGMKWHRRCKFKAA